jgi:beta-lactamase superfamily II metal-dependent hydrolase
MTATEVHILNVGAGSCTVMRSPLGHTSMIDINDGGELRSYEQEAIRSSKSLVEQILILAKEKQKLDDPIEWYRRNIGDDIFRFILSHPDKDHMSGIRRVLMGELPATNFWDIPHKRTRTKADFSSDAGWRDWQWYDAFRRGVNVTDVKWPKQLSPLRGDSRDYWAQDGIEILSPTAELVRDSDAADVYNDASYVLRVSHGATSSLLLASDVEEKAWNDMIATRQSLRANVLIASHHGRKSGYHAGAMALIRPEVVIVSTAKLPPAHDGVPLYRRHTDRVYSTRDHGTISIRMYDGGQIDIAAADGTHLVSLSDA